MEFEREARTDGMPTRELADRKRELANQLNSYINLRKQYNSTEDGRSELMAGASAPAAGGADGGLGTDGGLSGATVPTASACLQHAVQSSSSCNQCCRSSLSMQCCCCCPVALGGLAQA